MRFRTDAAASSRRRFTVWTVLAIAVLAGAAFLALRVLAPGGPLEVSIVNDTPSRIDGLVLLSGSGLRTSVPEVATDTSVTLRPRLGGREETLALVDPDGRTYGILGPFEGDPGGQVTVIIRGMSSSGLEGRVVVSSDSLTSGESALQPAPE